MIKVIDYFEVDIAEPRAVPRGENLRKRLRRSCATSQLGC